MYHELYDCSSDEISLDEVERIAIWGRGGPTAVPANR
jgi:hypothetical protein